MTSAISFFYLLLTRSLTRSSTCLLFRTQSTVAESFHWSGIVSSLTAGIAMNHFTVPNLSPAAKTLTGNLLSQLSQFADSVIFW